MAEKKMLLRVMMKQDAPKISQGILAEYEVKIADGEQSLQAAAMAKAEMKVLREIIHLEWEDLEKE